MIVSILAQAAFWASTPTAAWNSLNAASNAGDEYCDEFQTPCVLNAELRKTSGVGAVAVVDDAELGGARARRIGRRVGHHCGVVERAVVLRRAGVIVIPAGAAWLWSSTARSGISLQLAVLEGDLEVRHAGVRQQLLGHVDVLGPLRDRVAEVRVERRDDVVVGRGSPLPLNSCVMRAGRSIVRANAWRTRLSANEPLSQRIQIWRWLVVGVSTTVKFASVKSGAPRQDVELDEGVDLAALVGGDHRGRCRRRT